MNLFFIVLRITKGKTSIFKCASEVIKKYLRDRQATAEFLPQYWQWRCRTEGHCRVQRHSLDVGRHTSVVRHKRSNYKRRKTAKSQKRPVWVDQWLFQLCEKHTRNIPVTRHDGNPFWKWNRGGSLLHSVKFIKKPNTEFKMNQM